MGQTGQPFNIFLMVCGFLYGFSGLVGLFGNLTVVYITARSRRSSRNPMTLLIANLAVSDICVCLFCMPITFATIALREWVFGAFLCRVTNSVQMSCVFASTFTCVVIAIHRYQAILREKKAATDCRLWTVIISAVWIISFSYTVPLIIVQRLVQWGGSSNASSVRQPFLQPTRNQSIFTSVLKVSEEATTQNNLTAYMTPEERQTRTQRAVIEICQEQWPSEAGKQVFTMASTFLQYVLATLIIAFCYVRIAGVMRQQTLRVRLSMHSATRSLTDYTMQMLKRRVRKNRLVLLLLATFTLSWLPLNVVQYLIEYTDVETTYYFPYLFIPSHLIAMTSVVYNPFFYSWVSPEFRAIIRRVTCTRVFSGRDSFSTRLDTHANTNSTGGSKQPERMDLHSLRMCKLGAQDSFNMDSVRRMGDDVANVEGCSRYSIQPFVPRRYFEKTLLSTLVDEN